MDTTTLRTRADEYRAEGVNLIRADNDRLQGVRKVHEFLANLADGKPGLMIFEDCVESFATLATVVHDEGNPEDVNTKGDDHLYDAIRYGLTSLKPMKRAGGVQVVEKLPERIGKTGRIGAGAGYTSKDL